MTLLPIMGRYVVGAVLKYTLLVMLVLMILSGLYLFITQQDEIGTGDYQVADAFLFVALNLPQNAFEILPIGALIGALLGLGNLARSSELIVMRAAGVSVARIAAWVGLAGIVLAAGTWVLGEYAAPQLEAYAQELKTMKRFQQFARAGTRGAWAKDGDTFISVQQQSAENQFSGIYVFQFDAERRLQALGRASTAKVGANNEWVLENYSETTFTPEGIKVRREAESVLNTRLAPEFLGLASVRPSQLASRDLYAYVVHLKENGLESAVFETAFWARIARTASLIVVVMLAVPFSFGSLRSSGAGARMVVGILLGAVFFLLAQLLENGGQVFSLDPIVIAWGPTALLALTAAIAIARTR
ncbi:MAG: hypothetical protein RLZZ403_1333 [Pseudomonadota bacterium]|jgi:lipopolysaccharide export system permease protein